VETYRREWFPEGKEMVQGNRSDKQAGALVGLHFHRRQADYWYVPRGQARVVLHDLRVGSPTEAATMVLDIGDDDRGIYIPPGVGHGFAALTDLTITYLVDRYYDPADELGVAWDDPDIGADWGVAQPILSERDRTNPRRADAELPRFR
jgi:dTDP-4-dehydrorhamnose 3,5-epimerase